MDDLQRQLSMSNSDLAKARASLSSMREEVDSIKSKHEQLVKVGVEIARVGLYEVQTKDRVTSSMSSFSKSRLRLLKSQLIRPSQSLLAVSPDCGQDS